jgi:hypothetical protein
MRQEEVDIGEEYRMVLLDTIKLSIKTAKKQAVPIQDIPESIPTK